MAAQVTGDARRIAWLEIELRARCVGRRLVRPVQAEEVTVTGLAVDAGGRFGRLGRIVRFDSGPGGIDERFPVVVTGRLTGRFTGTRRLEGTASLTLRGRFYLGGGSGEGFYGERATCRTGGVRFSAELPRESRSRIGALRELQRGTACLFSRPRAGCTRVSGLGAPEKILPTRDGRHVYVVSSSPGRSGEEERSWLHGFARDRRTGSLSRIAGEEGCLRADHVPGCATLRGLDSIYSVAISPEGRNLYVVSSEPPAIATVQRNPSTGALTQLPGSAGCLGPPEEDCGPPPPFEFLGSPEVSPDGRHVYLPWSGRGAAERGVMWLPRNRASGVLGPMTTPGCIGARSGPPCRRAPVTGEVQLLALSGDSRHVYAGLDGGVLAAFARTASTGTLRPLREPDTCYFARTSPRGCAPRGDDAEALAVSPDGRTLYYAFDDAIALLARRRSGGLDQLDGQWACVGSELASGCRPIRGLELLSVLSVSPDGRNVYTGDYGDGLMAVFERRRGGRLLQLTGGAGCFVGRYGSPTPLYRPWRCSRTRFADEVTAIAPSPDGRHVYVASGVWPDFGGLHVFSRRTR